MSVAISEYTKDVRIVVDIDGPTKGESVTGFDVFEFTITKSGGFKAYPGEWSNGQLNCSLKQYGNPCSGAQHTGGGQSSCAAYIINKNWKRPDDYPYCHE
ncbi:MAG: hypothetical protein MJ180_06095 [Candidatus Gastranaerophilales bacterium]|nr:hypothetical protein [Candidatus Gastranaerophilales bacterium]